MERLNAQEVLLLLEPSILKWTAHFQDKELREEARQVARVACWRRLAYFDDTRGKSMASYFFMVVRSALINWYKKERRYQQVPLLPSELMGEEGEEGTWEERVADPTPVLYGEDLLWDAWMEPLKEWERTCLTLHLREGYSLIEVADLCQVPYERVKKWKQRGLARLKKDVVE